MLLVVQTAAGRYIKIFGILPNIAFCFTIVYSLTNGTFRSAILGLCCGILIDSTTDVAFGFNSLVIMYIALSASYFSHKYYYQNKFAVALGVFIYSPIYETILIVFSVLLFSEAPFLYSFFRYAFVEAIINSLISIPVFLWVKWLNNEYIRGI